MIYIKILRTFCNIFIKVLLLKIYVMTLFLHITILLKNVLIM